MCGAAVVSTRERRRSKGMCGGVPEETPGIEPRESAGVETQGIHEAVQAAAGLLDPFFADPDAETRAIERFWKTKQGNRRFGLFYMDWQAARTALPNESVSENEQARAFVRALRDGLRNKLEVHLLAQGVVRPTIERYASFAPMLDRNCPDTACITPRSRNSPAPAEKEITANVGIRNRQTGAKNESRRNEEKERQNAAAAHQQTG